MSEINNRIKELWEEITEKSKEFEKDLFTFNSPKPYTYNPKKKKVQIKKLKSLKKSLNKLRNRL